MRRIVLVCLGSALTLAAWVGCDRLRSHDVSAEVAEQLKEADQLEQARDFQSAADRYEQALRINPNHAAAHFKAAVLYDKKLDQFLPAIYHYEAFLKLEPGSERAKLAQDFLKNAQLQYLASLPGFRAMTTPDVARMQSENEALHRQISELKAELVKLREARAPVAARPVINLPKPIPSPQAAPPSLSVSPSPPVLAKPVSLPAQPAAPAPVKVRTYKVQKGEGLQVIARKIYGDKNRWRQILAANPQLKSAQDVHPGQVLKIP